MAFKKILMAAAATALIASPVFAAASDASALSLQPAPETVEGSALDGGSGTIWAVLLGGVILTGFILAAIDNIDDDDDVPVSP